MNHMNHCCKSVFQNDKLKLETLKAAFRQTDFFVNVEKMVQCTLKFCGIRMERFAKYVRPFFNIINKRVNISIKIALPFA